MLPRWFPLLVVAVALLGEHCGRSRRVSLQGEGGGSRRKVRKQAVATAALKERKPNIVLILTDDQDVELGSLNFMPRTLRLLRDAGAEFRHAYVTTPMCCPSRSSLLTGLYVHNHHVYTNNDNCSSDTWQASHETRTFATYLSNAGYRTGYFGKYLNKYNGSYIPPGWREWGGLIMNSRYYNYSINMNGRRIRHGDDYHKDYLPDLVTNDSLSFLTHTTMARKPLMLVISFPSPHGPEDAAPQYAHLFFNVTTHHTPSYDYAPNPDKQWILQVTPRMAPIHRQFTDLLMTKRLQTLQSVDEAVDRVCTQLAALGELDNTYVLLTSDHGYHLGQFGLVKGKSFPFEFDVRVPLLVRGPGVAPGTVVNEIVLNLDLAPTFLDMAGVEAPAHMDGRSFLGLLHRGPKHASRRHKQRWPDTFLIESSGRRDPPDRDSPPGQATAAHPEDRNWLEEGEGERESWRVHVDGDGDLQLDNRLLPQVPPVPPGRGVAPPPPSSKLARLALECEDPELRLPCRPGQRWRCLEEGGSPGIWRKHRCRTTECTCVTPEGHRYSARLSDEEYLQRRFLREHVTKDLKEFRPKFLMRHRRGVSSDVSNVSSDIIRKERRLLQQLSRVMKIKRQEEPPLGGCVVSTSGSVNCSRAVYSDLGVWRESRRGVEGEIRKLRVALQHYQRIRQHLHESRPHQASYDASHEVDDDDDDDEDDEGEEEDDENEDEEGGEYEPPQEGGGVSPPPDTFNENLFDDYDDPSMVNFTTGAAVSGHYSTDTVPPPVPPLGVNATDRKPLRPGKVETSQSAVYIGEEEDHVCTCDGPQSRKTPRRPPRPRPSRKERRRRKGQQCTAERMNCFTHDNTHWKTAPFWTEGPFCFCMNANNNSYSCVRTVNASHNHLYCEFVTGRLTYYNLRLDPFEQWNRVHSLSPGELSSLHDQLVALKACRGARQCALGGGLPPSPGERRKKHNSLGPGGGGGDCDASTGIASDGCAS